MYSKTRALFSAQERVARRTAEATEDIGTASRNIAKTSRVLDDVYQTPATKTGDKHLMALEQKIIQEDASLSKFMADESQRTHRTVRGELLNLYDDVGFDIAQREIAKDIDTQKMLLDVDLEAARTKVNVALSALDPKTPRPVVNQIVSNIIDDHHATARTHEGQLWGFVDDTATTTPSSIKALTQTYKDDVAMYLGDSAPEYLKRQLGRLNNKGKLTDANPVRLSDLKGLKRMRSDILATIRSERASQSPDWDKVRVLNNFQGNVLDAMEKTLGDTTELKAAMAFSREVNTKFKSGSVGKILGYAPDGGGRVPKELTLEMTAGASGGAKANVLAQELDELRRIGEIDISKVNPADMLEDYFKAAVRVTNVDGTVRRESINTFMHDNKALLKRFPNYEKALRLAIKEEKNFSTLNSEIKNLKGSKQLKFLDKLTEQQRGGLAKTILDTPDPITSLRHTMGKLSPQGQKGLKADFIRNMASQAKSGQDEAGLFVYNGSKMKSHYRENKDVFNHLLSREERARLIRLMNSTQAGRFPKEGLPDTGPPMKDIVAMVLQIPARIAGARVGAQLSGKGAGPSLQAAQMGASTAKKIQTALMKDKGAALMVDSVLDETLYKQTLKLVNNSGYKSIPDIRSLLSKPKYSNLRGWMIANGVLNFDEAMNEKVEE